MNKLARIIENLGYEELLLVQKDLDAGNIEKLIAKRLANFREQEMKICPVCEKKFIPLEGMKLEFGPHDLRQQAFFDGPDCLQYFMERNKG